MGFKSNPNWGMRVMLHQGRVVFFSVCAAHLQDCVCVLCNKRGATGVNMLEKSDLGQRPCLQLSR